MAWLVLYKAVTLPFTGDTNSLSSGMIAQPLPIISIEKTSSFTCLIGTSFPDTVAMIVVTLCLFTAVCSLVACSVSCIVAQQKACAKTCDGHVVEDGHLRDHGGQQILAFVDFLRTQRSIDLARRIERKATERLVERQQIFRRFGFAACQAVQQNRAALPAGFVSEGLFLKQVETFEQGFQKRPEDHQSGVGHGDSEIGRASCRER